MVVRLWDVGWMAVDGGHLEQSEAIRGYHDAGRGLKSCFCLTGAKVLVAWPCLHRRASLPFALVRCWR